MNINDLTIGEAREIASMFGRDIATEAGDIAASMIGKYCVVRTYSAGVHAGIVTARNGREILLTDSRRIWYWEGAASLSQLARDGTSKPSKCKFSVPVEEILVTEAVEVLPCTAESEASIRGVQRWRS